MPDEARFKQIQMIANIISSMPPQQDGGPRIPLAPPMVAKWATELHDDYGMRVHPEHATKMLEMGDTDEGGNFTPKRVENVLNLDDLHDLLRSFDNVPGLKKLADEIDEAKGDPTRESALRDYIRKAHPDVVATAEEIRRRAAAKGELG